CFAVFVAGGGVSQLLVAPVVSAEHMQVLLGSGGGDELALPFSHPAAPQRRMQAYRRFVHKEELGFGDGVERDVFFNQAVTCSIVSCAGRSCRWLRSCFGSFQR